MSLIRVEDIAYVRFSVPDLARMERFLLDFGLLRSDDQPDLSRLYMRGLGPAPFLHVTEEGEPAFAALGLRAASTSDLEVLAKDADTAVVDLDAPGGGKMVSLKDPDGYTVEIVAGQAAVEHRPLTRPVPWNSVHDRLRHRQTKRVESGAASVVRLGHAVLNVSDFRQSEAWYKSHFGFLTSDEIEMAPGASLGAFMRCDRGDLPTDHHTLFIAQLPSGPGFNHAAFEVGDLDDLMRGHAHLKQAQAEPEWGVGRHFLGSQVFDYWRDPWGFTLEHWTDGDLFTAEDPARIASVADLMGVQWGASMPPSLLGRRDAEASS